MNGETESSEHRRDMMALRVDGMTDRVDVPQQKILSLALKLAIEEKVANGLGKLAFIWATVVLLGAFGGILEKIDFYFVTIILLTQAVRIFSRTKEVEWQPETLRIPMACVRGAAKLGRRVLFSLQLLSALTCLALLSYRVAKPQSIKHSLTDTKNLDPALKIFYGLTSIESLLSLHAKFYWKSKISKLLNEVINEYRFDPDSEYHTLRCFFYEAYSRSVNGSIFDGLKMDFVTYSMELLQSSARDGQLTGTRVLSVLVKSDRFAVKTLRAIETMSNVVERLIEMLNWNHEQDIRKAAAEIVTELVTKNTNRIRVMAIAGSMESIASLLYSTKPYNAFVLRGLRILLSLAEDPSNCAKIGRSGGLLSKIVALTDLNLDNQIDKPSANLALQLVKKLVSSTGSTGKVLRKQILERVFAISNLRDVLEKGTHDLQILAIDTLRSLAREQDDRKRIGGTGGVLRSLVSLFFKERIVDNERTKELVNKAGEALGFLSLEDEDNCEIMMSIKLDEHPKLITGLISVLNDHVQGIHVAKILRNLCANAKKYSFEFMEITETVEQVLTFQMWKQSDKLQEAAIGLVAQLFKFMTKLDFDRVFKERWSEIKRSLISELVEVFRKHVRPSREVPNIRRFSIELLIAVMEKDTAAISEMRPWLKEALEKVMETTSEWEDYSYFSGSVGLNRHKTSIRSLAQSAVKIYDAGLRHRCRSLVWSSTIGERIVDNERTRELVNKAGEALGFLSLENEDNCEIMMSIKLDEHPKLITGLISVLNDHVQGIHVAKILRNLCPNAKKYSFEFMEITETVEQVLTFQMWNPSDELQEAAIGLVAQIFKLVTKLDFDRVFKKRWSEIKRSLISKLVEVFRKHVRPSREVPNIRRFSIELLIAVMEKDTAAISEMRPWLKEALEKVMETTSEWEDYSNFSGSVGLNRHKTSIRSLAQSAVKIYDAGLRHRCRSLVWPSTIG